MLRSILQSFKEHATEKCVTNLHPSPLTLQTARFTLTRAQLRHAAIGLSHLARCIIEHIDMG